MSQEHRRIGLYAAWGLTLLCAAGIAAADITPESLTVEHIRKALETARKALHEDPTLQPNYRPESDYVFWRTSLYAVPQELRNPMGNQALICWALLATGDSYQNPSIARRLHWVMSRDRSLTYDRGMRLAMLSQLPRRRWGRWVKRDVIWLNGAITDEGNFTESWFGQPNKGLGDNANGQYGTLGLWGYERAGYAVSTKAWKVIDKYWRSAMIETDDGKAGGWAVFHPKAFEENENVRVPAQYARRVSGPMTAGGVATLCITERAIHGPKLATPGKNNVSTHLRKGLRWLDLHFSPDDKAEETDRYYYFWNIQRVADFTGYRSFNSIDWYRAVTARIINEQQADGTWQGPKGRLISTGFAVLYLSEAYDPIAVAKLRFTGIGDGKKELPYAWNNRPHDVWNLVEYLSDQLEYGTSWHIVTLNLPMYTLMESPILYLSTDAAFEFGETEINHLRDYLHAGGMLITNPDAPSGKMARSVKKLGEQLFPGRKLEKIDTGHDLYNLHQDVPPKVAMQSISNGIRPLWIHFFRDIGEGLQKGDVARADGFRALSNIYLYVTGKNVRRIRLGHNYVTQRNTAPSKPLAAVRLKHAGNFDPEPGALQQLSAIAANDHDIKLDVKTLDPTQLSQEHKVAFLTTTGKTEMADAQVQALRAWLEGGGFLWLDAAGGGREASDAVQALATRIAGKDPIAPLPLNHPLISGDRLGKTAHYNRWLRYRNYALKSMGPVNVSRMQCIVINGKVSAVVSSHDLTCGLAGLEHWGIYGYSVPAARHLVANSLLWLNQRK